MKFLKRFSHKKELSSLRASIDELNASIRGLSDQLATLNAAQPAAKAKLPPPTGVAVAVVGTRGHGQKHIAAFNKLQGSYIHTICDVDTAVGTKAVEAIFKETGHRPKLVQNLDDALADEGVEAVSIATPHHWHALATVRALRAGKHVYVEKPITHSFAEGPAVLAAARKYGKVVQAGTQLRSNMSLRAAGEYMRAGKLGDITLVHCIVHKDRPQVPLSNSNKIPKTVDYDLWCGPADKDEVTRSKFHYHWHWLWRFGNGALGNNGIHRVDAARIALDLQGYGDLTVSLGGRYGEQDSGETPNNMLALHKFGGTWVLQDILGLNPKPFKGLENAVVFYGTQGTIVYKTGFAALVDENFKEVERFEGKQLNHYADFLRAIKDNKPDAVRGDLQEAILSGDLCHFGNISYRVGQPGDFAAARALLEGLSVPPMVFERLDALAENLAQNEVAPELTIGDVLHHTEDPARPFAAHPQAEALLSTQYREGYVLPGPDEV